ncbi:MAG: nuclear transport factor 2 family protein [Bryobacterales bacterium]|nr:nuclear transport factor 2 family protein [Bryobacterales bacterium]
MQRWPLLILVLAAGISASGESPEIRVERTERRWAVAVQAGDTVALTELCAEDMVYAHSTGEVETRAQYLAKFVPAERRYDAVEINQLNVKVLRELAIVNGRGSFRGEARGVAFDNRLAWTHIYVMRGAQWVMVAHQSAQIQ